MELEEIIERLERLAQYEFMAIEHNYMNCKDIEVDYLDCDAIHRAIKILERILEINDKTYDDCLH